MAEESRTPRRRAARRTTKTTAEEKAPRTDETSAQNVEEQAVETVEAMQAAETKQTEQTKGTKQQAEETQQAKAPAKKRTRRTAKRTSSSPKADGRKVKASEADAGEESAKPGRKTGKQAAAAKKAPAKPRRKAAAAEKSGDGAGKRSVGKENKESAKSAGGAKDTETAKDTATSRRKASNKGNEVNKGSEGNGSEKGKANGAENAAAVGLASAALQAVPEEARAVIAALNEQELAPKTRVHQLARLSGLRSKEVIELLAAVGIAVRSAQSTVTREQVAVLRDAVAQAAVLAAGAAETAADTENPENPENTENTEHAAVQTTTSGTPAPVTGEVNAVAPEIAEARETAEAPGITKAPEAVAAEVPEAVAAEDNEGTDTAADDRDGGEALETDDVLDADTRDIADMFDSIAVLGHEGFQRLDDGDLRDLRHDHHNRERGDFDEIIDPETFDEAAGLTPKLALEIAGLADDGPATVTPPPAQPSFAVPVFMAPTLDAAEDLEEREETADGTADEDSADSADTVDTDRRGADERDAGADASRNAGTGQGDEDEDAQGTRRRRRGRRGRGRNAALKSETPQRSKDSESGEASLTESEEPEAAEESESSGLRESREARESRKGTRHAKSSKAGKAAKSGKKGKNGGAGAADDDAAAEQSGDHEMPLHPAEKDPADIPNAPVRVKGSTRLAAARRRRDEQRADSKHHNISEAEFLARRESVERRMVVREAQRHDNAGMVTQVAVLEDDLLVEHFVTSERSRTLVGNVYLGRVQNVLPSMEAAFIDIGTDRNGVLYAGEVDWKHTRATGRSRRIESALRPGDPVLVQVTKDSVGHKGPRLTSHISLAGRFLVYVPEGRTHGISRKLAEPERRRLKKIVSDVLPETGGAIIRTAAEGVGAEDIAADVERLQKIWASILNQADELRTLPGSRAEQTAAEEDSAPGENGGSDNSKDSKSSRNNTEDKPGRAKPHRGKRKFTGPMPLYEEPNLLVKVVRDLFNEDFSQLVVDGDRPWEVVSKYVHDIAPDLEDRLLHYDPSKQNGRDAFEKFRVDEQLEKALSRTVWLPSGGTLVIDRTEAMTVIDVNTGRFTGSGGNLEETVTRNNLEAAEEIVRQMRLRDLGGMIVVDFIDMVLPENRDLVVRRLSEALGRDRTRHQVGEVTSLGLVQITRKRLGNGLLETFSTKCEHCGGRGVIVHQDPVLLADDADDYRDSDAGDDSASAAAGASGSSADTLESLDAGDARGSGNTRGARDNRRTGDTRGTGVAEPSGSSESPDGSVDQDETTDSKRGAHRDSAEKRSRRRRSGRKSSAGSAGSAGAHESSEPDQDHTPSQGESFDLGSRSIEEIAAAAVIVASEEDPDEPSGADYLPAEHGHGESSREAQNQETHEEEQSAKRTRTRRRRAARSSSAHQNAAGETTSRKSSSDVATGAEEQREPQADTAKPEASRDLDEHEGTSASGASGRRRGRRRAARTVHQQETANQSAPKPSFEEAQREFEQSPRRKRATRGNSRSDVPPRQEDFADHSSAAGQGRRSQHEDTPEQPAHDDVEQVAAPSSPSSPSASSRKENGADVTEPARRGRGRRRATRRSSGQNNTGSVEGPGASTEAGASRRGSAPAQDSAKAAKTAGEEESHTTHRRRSRRTARRASSSRDNG